MRIITHDGFFHADEVFAIALLHKVMGVCPVERRRNISIEEFDDPNIWVLDVGRRYQPLLHNFDHHQDADLDSSNLIILDELLAMGKIDADHHAELKETFTAISEIDQKGYAAVNGFQVNSLIRTFNNIENGWEFSLQVAGKYIDGCFDTVSKIDASRNIWSKGEIIRDVVRICSACPIHWKRYKEEPFLVFPESDGNWKLISIDSTVYPLKATGKEIFMHNEKFIAVYAYRGDAIECAVASWIEVANRRLA